MDKSSFLMYIDWNDMIEELDDQSRGQLLLAIMRYQSGAELPEMDIGAKGAFAQIRNQFRKDEEKYSRTVANRSAAGKLGGRPKANASAEKQKKQMLFEESSTKQTEAKKADNVNVNDNVLKENTLKGVKEKRFAPPTPENVRGYCREMGYANVDAERFVDFYAAKDWMIGKNRMKDWKAAVRNWARQDHSSAAGKQKKNAFLNFDDRGTDYDAMVAEEARRMIQDSGGGTDEQH